MKTVKRLFALFTAILLIIAFSACNGVTAKDFEYEEVTGGINITAYNGKAKNLAIPETINNKKVISIADNALSGNINIEKLILPQYIDKINVQALQGCDNLKYLEMQSEEASFGGSLYQEELSSVSELVLPNAKTVKSLPSAFNNLKSVNAPNCINYAAFSDSLEEITIKSTPQIIEFGIINSLDNPLAQDVSSSYNMYYIYGLRTEDNSGEFQLNIDSNILSYIGYEMQSVNLNDSNRAMFLCSAFKKHSIKINGTVYESNELYPPA